MGGSGIAAHKGISREGHQAVYMRNLGLSLVAPAYNEGKSIAKFARTTDRVLSGLDLGDYEIIVVDDGSTDDTWGILKSLTGEIPGMVVTRHDENRGYGAAIMTGIELARMDYIAYTDADLQFDLLDLSRFIEQLRAFDAVLGYREMRQDPGYRIIMARAYNEISNRIFGLPSVIDIDCALKVFRRSTLESVSPHLSGFGFDLELVAKLARKGYPFVQVPVRHIGRCQGKSKVNIPRVLETLREIMALSRELSGMTEDPAARARSGT